LPVSNGARFVGREAQLERLRVELAAALRGEGRLVVLSGEPGVGKTRTATALSALAQEQGAVVVWGRCHERAGAPAYWPFVQAISAHPSAPALAELVPVLRALEQPPVPDGSPERARFELLDRVALALGATARAAPFVLVIDDLHWADVGSLLLLESLAPALAGMPLLVLATLRDTEVQPSAERASLLASALRSARRIPLGGLARAEVAELLADQLGKNVPAEVLDEVVAATECNPFFVIEMAQLLAVGAGPKAAVPPGVSELLRRRRAPLPEPAQRILRAASVMGREFDLDVLARVVGASPESVLESLAAPLRLGLVREVPGALRRFAFSHALMRETLYHELSPSERVALHGAVGAALEVAESGGDERLSALAHHFFEAGKVADPTKAARYGCEAGERALRLLAFEEAVMHFERALAALSLLDDDDTRLRALTGLGDGLHGAGHLGRMETTFRQAVQLARKLGPDAFGATVFRFALARAQLALPDVELNALLDEALGALPEAPSPLRARLLARLSAGLLLQPGGEARRRTLSDEALHMARGLGDDSTLRFVLTRRLIGLLGPDQLEQRLATTSEILRAKRRSRAYEAEALLASLADHAERADRVALDASFAAFDQLAQASREPVWRWTAASARAGLALVEGRMAEAESLATQALALGRAVETRLPRLRFAQQIVAIRGWQARLSEIGPLLENSVAQASVVPAWRCALADYYCVSGRETEARRELAALAVDDFSALPRDANWLIGMALLADLCGRLRDAGRAATLYALLRPYAGRIAVAGPLTVLAGSIDARLGVLATTLERFAEAEAHFEQALALAERMRALPWRGLIRFQQAELYVARAGLGDRERALENLDESEVIAETVGMLTLQRWVAANRQALRRGTVALVSSASGTGRVTSESARRTNVVALVPRANPTASAPAARSGALERDGDVWTFVFEGRTTRVRHMLGLSHVARLLREPGRELHVAELVDSAYIARRPAVAETEAAGDSGELLDARARASYESRLREAREELELARRHNDRGQTERLVDEIELLTAELSRGFGLGGRARRAGAASERARVAVTRAIKYAIDKLAEHDVALAEHLRNGIRTGAFCVYSPSSRDPVIWS
jgi:tetratricopeptide (TPR) repeat protein